MRADELGYGSVQGPAQRVGLAFVVRDGRVRFGGQQLCDAGAPTLGAHVQRRMVAVLEQALGIVVDAALDQPAYRRTVPRIDGQMQSEAVAAARVRAVEDRRRA